jgi:RNA polymerase sigma-70 factor (ECF subfamily)
MSKCTDEELMVHIQNHQSHAALIELHKRYSNKLLGFFFKMLGKDEEKAQDFVQDIFLKLLEKNHLFDSKRNFYTWIFTIANNMCKSEYRNVHNSQASNSQFEQVNLAELGENLAEKGIFHQHFQKALFQLDENQKHTFILRYMEHFSLQEIAEITQTSLGTVKSRLFYGTQKMAKELKEFNPKNENNLFKLI